MMSKNKSIVKSANNKAYLLFTKKIQIKPYMNYSCSKLGLQDVGRRRSPTLLAGMWAILEF